jgi:2'-5' RNA ligase
VPRRRLGVVLLVPGRAAGEVQGIRRACADPALDTVPPHLTLVPPVNVAEEDLPEALALLRREAAATAPLAITLGPSQTFLPIEPVLYLEVGGDEQMVGALLDLRERVFTPPLARPLSHAFVPHVTICAGGTPEWIQRASQTLVAYEDEVVIDRLTLLEERRPDDGDRVWVPIADAPFAPPAVVARGGLEVELTVTELVDPEVWPELPPDGTRPAEDTEAPDGCRPLVVTARRDGDVLGAATGWTSGACAALRALVVSRRVEAGEDVAGHLQAAFASAAADRGATGVEHRLTPS